MYKNGISENCKFALPQLLMIKIYQDLLLKNGLKFMISQVKITMSTKKLKIRIKTPMLRADLCDFSDACIVAMGDITVTELDNAKRNKSLALKNNAPFINCIWKINGVEIDSAEDLDVVMPMYNLLVYSKNYQKTTGSL